MAAQAQSDVTCTTDHGILADLQRLLEVVYGMDVGLDVRDFVISDRNVADGYSPHCSTAGETLLILQEDDVIDVGLYLDEAVLARASARESGEHLRSEGFSDFCKVIEGVSHFNYVAHCASRNSATTLMELEMQAEVDKYVAARLIAGASAPDLVTRLFESWSPGPWLDQQQTERYRVASDFAGRFCASLERRYPSRSDGQAMFGELRSFYRQREPGKVSHIASVQLT